MVRQTENHPRILWQEVNSITDGHGVEVYYAPQRSGKHIISEKEKILIAFFKASYWLDEPAEEIIVEILKPESALFGNWQAKSQTIIGELKQALPKVIQSRTFPPDEFGKNFGAHVNA